MPSASVIIPAHNKSQAIRLALASLESQRTSTAFEVVVVVDHSSDDTAAIARGFSRRFTKLIVIERTEGDGNVSAARNLGVQVASGAVIIFLDADFCVNSCFVDEHLRLHQESNQDVAVIGYMLGYWGPRSAQSEKERQLAPDLDNDWAAMINNPVVFDTYPDLRENTFRYHDFDVETLPAPWALFWTGNASVLRKSFSGVGGFDEGIVNAREDIEFGYRLHQHGVRFRLGRRAFGIHRPHEYGEARRKLSVKNREIFFSKHQSLGAELVSVVPNLVVNQVMLEMSENLDKWSGLQYPIDALEPIRAHLVDPTRDRRIACIGPGQLNSALDLGRVTRIYPESADVTTLACPQHLCLAGIKTPFDDQSFEAVIITDYWRSLPVVDFSNGSWRCDPIIVLRGLIAEARRIGERVFLFHSLRLPFGNNAAWVHCGWPELLAVCRESDCKLVRSNPAADSLGLWELCN